MALEQFTSSSGMDLNRDMDLRGTQKNAAQNGRRRKEDRVLWGFLRLLLEASAVSPETDGRVRDVEDLLAIR